MKKIILGLVLGMMIGSATVAFAADTTAIKEIKATLASFNLVINGHKKEIRGQQIVYENTLYVPVREISTYLGYNVGFDKNTNTVELKNPVSLDPNQPFYIISKDGLSVIDSTYLKQGGKNP